MLRYHKKNNIESSKILNLGITINIWFTFLRTLQYTHVKSDTALRMLLEYKIVKIITLTARIETCRYFVDLVAFTA